MHRARHFLRNRRPARDNLGGDRLYRKRVIFGAITQVWKISFHTGVFTGCVTVLVLILHDARFAWLFLLVPLIAWARVRRKRHTLVQTVVGALIALINTVVVLSIVC